MIDQVELGAVVAVMEMCVAAVQWACLLVEEKLKVKLMVLELAGLFVLFLFLNLLHLRCPDLRVVLIVGVVDVWLENCLVIHLLLENWGR